MADNEYLCLSCGRHYMALPAADDTEKATCPRCNGTNVLKINISGLFGLSGGG